MGSSPTRGRTRVPCIGRWILNHYATRETLTCRFYNPPKGSNTVTYTESRLWHQLNLASHSDSTTHSVNPGQVISLRCTSISSPVNCGQQYLPWRVTMRAKLYNLRRSPYIACDTADISQRLVLFPFPRAPAGASLLHRLPGTGRTDRV